MGGAPKARDEDGRLALPLWITFTRKAPGDLPIEDFAIPENVIAMPVNHMTGQPVSREEKDAILEYFIRGTKPKLLEARSPRLPGRSAQASPSIDVSPPSAPPSSLPAGGLKPSDT